MPFDAGSVIASLELNRDDFQAGLDQAKADAEDFEAHKYQAKLGIDKAAFDADIDEAKAKLDELGAKKVSPNIDPTTRTKLQDIASAANDATSHLSNAGSSASAAAGGMSLLVKSAIALGPALVPIGAVAAGSLSILPALATGGIEAMGALKLGFEGVSTALGEFMRPLGLITPAAAEFAATVSNTLLPGLLQTRDIVQANMFGPMLDGLNAAMPAVQSLEKGMGDMGTVIGGLTAQFGQWLASSQGLHDVNTLVAQSVLVFQQLGQAGEHVLEAILNIGADATPLISELLPHVQNVANAFLAWTQGSGLTSFIAYVQREMPVVTQTIDLLARGFVDLLKDVAPIGDAILKVFNAFGQGLTQSHAQTGLQAIGVELANVLRSATPLATTIGTTLGGAFTTLARDITAGNFTGNLRSILNDLTSLAKTGGPGFMSGFSLVFASAGPAIAAVVKPLADLIVAFSKSNPAMFTAVATAAGLALGLAKLQTVFSPLVGAIESVTAAIEAEGLSMDLLGGPIGLLILGLGLVGVASYSMRDSWSTIWGDIENIAINTVNGIINNALNPLITAWNATFGHIPGLHVPYLGDVSDVGVAGDQTPVNQPGNPQYQGGAVGSHTAPEGPPAPGTAPAPAGQSIPNTGRASGGPVEAGQPYTVGEQGPEQFVPGTSGTIIPNGATAGAGAAGGGLGATSAVAPWQQASAQIQPIWAQLQARYQTLNTQLLATTQTFGTQQVTAQTASWTLARTQTEAVWTDMQARQQAANVQNLSNTQAYGNQTVASLNNTWTLARTQGQTAWQQMLTQYQATNFLSLASTQAYGAQTVNQLNDSWTQARTQSESTWQQMTSTLQTENATQLENVTTSSNAAKQATLTAYQGLATDLPGIVTGIWNSTDNAYKGGINNTIGDLDKFLQGVDAVGSQVNWAVNLNVPMLAGGGRYTQATAIVGEGRAPEYAIPTDPAYHSNAVGLLANMYHETGGRLGVPGFDQGGILPAAVTDAMSFIGTPYAFGGASRAGTDCSGLIYQIGQMLGVPMARTSEGQFAQGPPAPAPGGPGMPIFFDTHDGQAPPSHVGLYLGGGNMIDAPHSGTVVQTEGIAGFGDMMGFTNPFGASAANIPQWATLPAPPTLAGESGAVANAVAAQVTTFLVQKQQAYVAALAAMSAQGGAGGVSGAGQGGPGSMSPAAIQQLWIAQGGPASAAVNMSGIAQAESGDNPNIVQQGEPPGLTGWGLYQITPTSGIPGGPYLLDPAVNTQKAIQLFSSGGYGPWRGDPYASSHGLAEAGGKITETGLQWLAEGGRVKSFDTGYGTIDPGLTMVNNGTGAPETLGPLAGATVAINLTVNGTADPQETYAMSRQAVLDALAEVNEKVAAT